MESEVKPKWSFKSAIRNTFTWDKQDLHYVLFTLIILGGAYLYWSEVHMAQYTLEHLNTTCEIYQELKEQKQEACSLTTGYCAINNSELIKEVIKNLSNG